MRAVCGSLERRVPVVPLEDFPARLPEPPRARDGTPDGTTEAALLYTSGTTGRPKGCILSNEYFHTWGTWYAGAGGVIGLRPGQERMYNPLPLHHANCLGISVSGMLVTGGALFFPDRFHASTWWKDLVDCGITALHYQGVIPNVLLTMPPSPLEQQHQVRFGFGAGIDASQHAECERRFGFPFVEFWAMSETGRFITDNLEPRLIDTRAIGRGVPGLEARAVDANGQDMPDGKPGELVIRHSAAPRKGFFSGYLWPPSPRRSATAPRRSTVTGSAGCGRGTSNGRRSCSRAMATAEATDGKVHPNRILAALQAGLDADSIAIVDGGDFLSFARVGLSPGTMLDPGAFGCTGIGVPFGIAASLAFPDKRVLVATGDGAFGFNAIELDTAVRHNMPP